jgi:hypothetical protein
MFWLLTLGSQLLTQLKEFNSVFSVERYNRFLPIAGPARAKPGPPWLSLARLRVDFHDGYIEQVLHGR